MQTLILLQKSIDYIEENLKSEINTDELASISGFSVFRYYHLFSAYVGLPVLTFVTKRKLMHIICEAYNGRSMIEVALEYGFSTHAGFYKAFKREYGCSPKKYLEIGDVKKPSPYNLREESKIMLTQNQIKKILSNWDIDKTVDIGATFIRGGEFKSDHTWFVGDDYVLKTGKNIGGLRRHIHITKTLDASGIDAASPLMTRNSEEYILHNGWYFILIKRLKGEFLLPHERYDDNRVQTSIKYGKAIGKLHKALADIEDSEDIPDVDLYDSVMKWAMPGTKKVLSQWDCSLPDEFYEDYETNFKEIYPALNHQLIHRDPNPSNIIFDNGEVVGFVDFEISQKNVRMIDPCYCATGILSEANKIEDGYKKWPEILEGILRGYNQICPITDKELEAIPYIVYSIQMIFIAYLDGKHEFKDIAMENRKMLLWMWENRENCFKNIKL